MHSRKFVAALLILVLFAFFTFGNIGCKKKQPKTQTEDDFDVKDPAKPADLPKIELTSEKAKTFLLSEYGKSWGKGSQAFYFGVDALAVASLMRNPNPLKPSEEPKLAEMLEIYLDKQDTVKGSWVSPHQGVAVYETSAVILALASAVRIDDDWAGKERAINAIRKGVDYLLLAQVDERPAFEGDVIVQPEDKDFNAMHRGGWIYGHSRPGKAPANMSTTNFALEALYESGLRDSEDVKEALQKAVEFLENCQNLEEKAAQPFEMHDDGDTSKPIIRVRYGTDGGGIYSPGTSKAGYEITDDGFHIPRSYASMTYVLLKGYIFAGLSKNDPRIIAAFSWITQAENFTFEKNAGFLTDAEAMQGYLYFLYTASKALAVYGKEEIEDSKGEKHNWKEVIKDTVISLQKENGSWINEKASRWDEGNPILATAYMLLTLGHITGN